MVPLMRYLKMKTYRHCPKCKGILNIAKDHHGWFVECINCGFTRDIELLHAKGDKFSVKENPLKVK